MYTPRRIHQTLFYVPLAHHSCEKGISRRLMFFFFLFSFLERVVHTRIPHIEGGHTCQRTQRSGEVFYTKCASSVARREMPEGCIGPHKLSPVCSCTTNKECRIVLCVLCGPSSFGGRHSRRPHIIHEFYEDGQTDC